MLTLLLTGNPVKCCLLPSEGFAYAGNNVIISPPTIKTYFLDKPKTPSDIVIECINEMLKPKYNKAIFYTHNLGGYDVVFVLKILAEYNKKIGARYYNLKAILRDKRILKAEISVKNKSVTNTIFLVDSLALLPMSLDSLGEAFSTKFKKNTILILLLTRKILIIQVGRVCHLILISITPLQKKYL
jgi:hypothetical protein